MKTRALAALPGIFVLACALAGQPGTARAQQRVHPRLFALAATTFPSGSRIVRSNVETNMLLLADEATHFGLPPAVVGRITGYYMSAHDETSTISYLVSIFASAHKAQSAFDYRWDLWYMANFYTAPPAPQMKLGSGGAEALFQSLDPRQPPTTELFFRRGCVLVEVVEDSSQDQRSAGETRALYAIARALDVVARSHPRGV
jgi:hypothetical protein